MDDFTPDDGDLDIEAPSGLLPDLTIWGIEEYEKGVCEDTYENRRTLRDNKCQWNVVFDRNGYPSGYIQAVTPEMYQMAQGLNKADLLTEPKDFNSEYLSGFDLLTAPDADKLAPSWVLRTTRVYFEQEEQRRILGADADLMQSRLVQAPTRCSTIKSDGTRCWGWASGATESSGLCTVHARRANRKLSTMSTIQAARNRIASAAVGAVDRIEYLAEHADTESVRYQANRDLLDRAGLRGVIEVEQKVEVTVNENAEIVKARLAKLAKGHQAREEVLKQIEEQPQPQEDIVDAEVVAVYDE